MIAITRKASSPKARRRSRSPTRDTMPHGRWHVLVLEVVVALLVLVGVAIVVSRDVPGLDDAGVDRRDLGLPDDRLLHSEDIDQLQFGIVTGPRGGRGYRFGDVDATLAAVQQ